MPALHILAISPQWKDARARGENARTCDALQKFRNESTKIKKMRFSAIFGLTFSNQAKIL